MFFFAEDEPTPSPGMPKTADYLCASRGTFHRDPQGICWVRMSEDASQTPVFVMGELLQNTSTSVTNMAEFLAPELVQRHVPHRFEELPPAIFLEHYTSRSAPRKGGWDVKPTWDRLSFHSWVPRRVWLSGSKPRSARRRCRRCRHRFRTPTIRPRAWCPCLHSPQRRCDSSSKGIRSPVTPVERVRGAAFVSVLSLRAGISFAGLDPSNIEA